MLDPRPPEHMAWIDVISKLPDDEREDFIQALNINEQALVDNAWPLIARREQLPPPGDWSVWINLAGRGAGKTRSGSEWIIENHRSGRMTNTALIGSTVGDVRKYMIDGNSGIIRTAPDDFKPVHNPSLRKVVWPNGTESHTYSAEDPERLRGPNHDGAWADELAAWQYLEETWDMLAAVHEDYAARFGDMGPRNGVYRDTQMEENGWTSCGLASVSLVLENAPRAADWARNARRWIVLRDGSVTTDTTDFDQALQSLHPTDESEPRV